MSKRKKTIIVSLLLALGLAIIQMGITSRRFLAILLFSLASIGLSFWALREGRIKRNWWVILLLPVMFTMGIGFFYFLLPSGWGTRIPIIVFYALGMYVLLLTENIYGVASSRNIQLLRSAQATGFLMTLLVAFFLFDTILSYRLNFWINALAVAIVSFLLFYQGLWSVVLKEEELGKLMPVSFVLGLVMGEIALVISFWPLSVATASLFLITFLYLFLGLKQNALQGRLFKKTVKEYLWVGLIVFLTIFLTTQWGS
ncbi:hypothetical protein ACFLZP_00835 [Patescibacteria group bacterium]